MCGENANASATRLVAIPAKRYKYPREIPVGGITAQQSAQRCADGASCARDPNDRMFAGQEISAHAGKEVNRRYGAGRGQEECETGQARLGFGGLPGSLQRIGENLPEVERGLRCRREEKG